MQIHLSSLGCRLNEAELESWASSFRAEGHQIVRDPEDADVLVLNTCAVTQEAVRKSRKSIQRLHRRNATAQLVVSGCYSTLSSEAEHRELGIDLVVSNSDKDHLVAQVTSKLALSEMPEAATLPTNSALFERSRQRAFIKIQDGCRYRCTYCIVTIARGEERSRSISEIVNEVNQLHATGIQEIALTGVHVGGYGCDLGTDLYSLVKTLLEDTNIPRIRFASVEPWDLPDNFFSLFANPRLMPHMHLPLQSGSDTVLRRMARRCKTADFRRLIDTIRQSVPGFNVTTDIIVGFPGETESEWRESYDYIESIGFGHIHIFSFSAREGTKAARLGDQVHGAVKRKRSQELHRLASEHKKLALADMLGQQAQVLWESGREVCDNSEADKKLVRYAGYTPNYHRVCTDVADGICLENTLTMTTLNGMNEKAEYLTCQAAGLENGVKNYPRTTQAAKLRTSPSAMLDTKTINTVIPITPI